MCHIGEMIKQEKLRALSNITKYNTDADVMFGQIHLECSRAWNSHSSRCAVCSKEVKEAA
jgi:hypothetical protein